MPEPFSLWATDHPIYKYVTNPLAKNICFMNPNTVTLTAWLCIIPIVMNIITNGSRIGLVFWMALRALLDCLDGSIARSCKRVTEVGAFLDVLGDMSYILSTAIAIGYVVFKNKLFYIPQLIIMAVMVVGSFSGIYECLLEATGNSKKRFNNIFTNTIHDNTVIFSIVGAIVINMFIKRPLGRPI